jgi:outer membrane protein TolC
VLLRVVVLFVGALSAAPAWPQQRITEAEFLTGIGPDHPAARSTLDRLGEAEAALSRARQLANPRLDYTREQPSADASQDTVTLAWTPPLDGRRGLAIAAARAGHASAEAERAAQLVRVRLLARGAFATWSQAWERRTAASQVLGLASDLARKTRLKAEAGEEAGLAAGRIELQRAAIAADLAEADAAYARARAVAQAWRPEIADAEPAPLPLTAPVAGSAGESPALIALRQALESARLNERLAGRFWTAPELQAGIQRQDQGSGRASGPVLGISWTVPVLDRGRAARLEALRRREAAEARLQVAEARRNAAVAGSMAALDRLTAAAAEAHTAADRAPALALSALASFGAAEATVTDVLDTLRSAHEARRREIDARAAAAAAARELEAAQAGLGMGEVR